MTPTRISNETNTAGGALTTRRRQARQSARADQALRSPTTDRARVSRLRLRLSASAEEVPYARAAITRLCEHLEIADEVAERIRLAVTEACTNCVLHAYHELAETATYGLDAGVDAHGLRVTVYDRGLGMQRGRPSEHDGLGLGLGLVEQLADSWDVSSRPSGGTRVVMRFALPS